MCKVKDVPCYDVMENPKNTDLIILCPSGTVTLNGQRKPLPVVTGDLVLRKASSSFLLIQTFGAQLLWHLDGPMILITLQPHFTKKVTCTCMALSVDPLCVLSGNKLILSSY